MITAYIPFTHILITNHFLLCREILDEDVVTPEKGRAVAKEIGAFYYETSVLERYGIDDVSGNVFMNDSIFVKKNDGIIN